MYKTEANFKVGQLKSLNNLKFEISKQDEQLVFYIEGVLGKDVYSFDFITTGTEKDLLKIKIGEKVNFLEFIDGGDIVIGKNKSYTVVDEISISCTQFVENRFLLEIFFKIGDEYVGEMELCFSIDD